MIHFPNKTLQRYVYTSSGQGVYGETISEYQYVDDVLVDFQNENNQELAQAYGVDLQNLFKVYFDINTVVNDNDQFRDSQGNKYHILGNIQVYDHFLHYKRAHLVLERDGG